MNATAPEADNIPVASQPRGPDQEAGTKRAFVLMPFKVRPDHLAKYLGDSNHWTEV